MSSSQLDYYDYVIEETGNGMLYYFSRHFSYLLFLDVFVFDGEKWSSSLADLPQPLQGSCAVEFLGKILLIGKETVLQNTILNLPPFLPV